MTVAGEWTGDAGLEYRGFLRSAGQSMRHGNNLSFYMLPEYFHDWDEGNQRVVVAPFLRLDDSDSERSHFDFRELYWQHSFDTAELTVGLRRVFWGVTESAHLVDIINQTDLVENLDTEDKLGQPMIKVTLLRNWGTVDLFVMPFFRERTFPGVTGRPGTPLYVDESAARYESGAEDKHIDLAVRWSHYFGDLDIGIAHFSGTSREPSLSVGLSPGVSPLSLPQPVLIPFYDQIQQTSLDLQLTKGSWLWKLEAFNRSGQGPGFQALAAGVEYTFVGIAGTAADLGLIGEYLRDNRRLDNTLFDKDIALGFRLAFNDTQSTELLAFSGVDIDTRERFSSIEGNRRLGQSWRLGLEGRFFSNTAPASLLSTLRNDDYLEVSLTKFF